MSSIWGLGLGAWGLGPGAWGLGPGAWGLGFRGIKFTTLNDSTEEFFVVQFETSQKEEDGLLTYWQRSDLYVLALVFGATKLMVGVEVFQQAIKELILKIVSHKEAFLSWGPNIVTLLVYLPEAVKNEFIKNDLIKQRNRYDKYLSNTSYDLIQDWKKFSKDAFKYDPEDVKLIHRFLEPGHLTEKEEKKVLKQLEGKPRVVYKTMYNKNLDGARIGVVAKTSAEFVASVLAIWLSGGVAVPLEPSNPKDGLLHVMTDAGVSMILSTVDHSELMREIARKSGAGFSLIPDVLISDVNDDVHSKEIQFSDQVDDHEPALILFTSGRTGKPKGVVHTHRSILAQVKTLATASGYTSSDCILHCMPLHHIHKRLSNSSQRLETGVWVSGKDGMNPYPEDHDSLCKQKIQPKTRMNQVIVVTPVAERNNKSTSMLDRFKD
ncbi:malonate--CoA ligase [Tanacetum coccineum]